jgi:hypothetical protein
MQPYRKDTQISRQLVERWKQIKTGYLGSTRIEQPPVPEIKDPVGFKLRTCFAIPTNASHANTTSNH